MMLINRIFPVRKKLFDTTVICMLSFSFLSVSCSFVLYLDNCLADISLIEARLWTCQLNGMFSVIESTLQTYSFRQAEDNNLI